MSTPPTALRSTLTVSLTRGAAAVLTVVQGVGHSGPLMLGSPQGIQAIFFPD